jgi:uncharacterized protein (DUF1778 family)
MSRKTDQLQIRVTPLQKEALKRRARRAGLDVSAYVLSRALPSPALRFAELLDELRREEQPRYALAALNDFLAGLGAADLDAAVSDADLDGLSDFLRNYVAAMVEQAAHLRKVAPPAWVREIDPLDEPWFAVPFASLRPHLLAASPVAFKRRNLFVDSTVGDRV